MLSTFRQLVANGRIKFNLGFLSVEPKEDDLARVHDVVNEIDNRRVFHQAYEDEIPEYMVKSVREARETIQELRKGVWADNGTREVVQYILHELAEFLTKSDRGRIPRNHHDAGFAEFGESATELRLKVWTAIAHLYIVYGEEVKPYHLPQEILDTVREHVA